MLERFSLWRHGSGVRPLPLAVIALGLFLGPVGIAAGDEDWPIKLTLREDNSGRQKHWDVTAENLADFACTKLRLEVSLDGGTLEAGGGQSTASLVNGKLVFKEVASLPAHGTCRWTVDYEADKGGGQRMLRTKLEYAEKSTPHAAQPAQPAQPAKAAQPSNGKPCRDYSPPTGSGMTVAEISFPTGSRATSALLVHQVMPVEIERKSTFTYQYYVTNISSMVIQNVELQASGFHNLNVAKADPPAEGRGDVLRWAIGDLGECETRIITVQATSPEVGTASACLMANFSNRLCAMTKVVEPGLELVKAAPPEALICDEITMVLTATNPGSGLTRNVRISETLPDGLTTTDGKRKLEGDIGNLAAGETKKLEFRVKAAKPGSYSGGASALAAADLKADSNKTTTVFRQPVLQISCSSPESAFMGRTLPVTIEVQNLGDAAARDTVVMSAISAGAEVSGVTKGGTVGKGGITWNLGSLPPKGSQSLGYEVKSVQAATLQFQASVSGVCATQVQSSTCETKIIGIPAILLEVVDVEDPVEVGKPATYVITVTNQGTANGTNIKVGCDIPAQMTYVSSTGPTQGTLASNNRLTLGTIASLGPKQKVEWRISVTAKSEGDARIGVDIASDQFAAPIHETESTNVYKYK